VKDLYTEDATVAALSDDEVAKLRAARATVVEGSTLKPVLQFNQAGVRRLQHLLSLICRSTRKEVQVGTAGLREGLCWRILLPAPRRACSGSMRALRSGFVCAR